MTIGLILLIIFALPPLYCVVVGLALFWQFVGGRVTRAVVWQFGLAVVLTVWMNAWLVLASVEFHVVREAVNVAVTVLRWLWPVMVVVAITVFFLPMVGMREEARRAQQIARPVARWLVWLHVWMIVLLISGIFVLALASAEVAGG